ncbi:MAG: hypothetical protein CVT88_04515 [Candidatus Altiarchaeales archaeon HGW-Altiarchaeales-1]|nr:MAG: hypothetical protein CVT89_06040 [Candidatus Altiarchaeales archaeon HGW-Altiarchaeales-2]PKP59797.1 MAG: hypothetical protein CVT88_04515 [Candidatus Altiarchaeales archaeon HGW-Altiarchaeales-1]
MDTNKKILLWSLVIFAILIGIFIVGNLFELPILPIVALLVLFLLFVLLLVLLFVKKRKPVSTMSKEEQLKIKERELKFYKFGGIFFFISGIIYLTLLFVSDEIRLYNIVLAGLWTLSGILYFYTYFKLKTKT